MPVAEGFGHESCVNEALEEDRSGAKGITSTLPHNRPKRLLYIIQQVCLSFLSSYHSSQGQYIYRLVDLLS